MKLYLISQDVNDGYDTFDSAVVAAHNEDEAKNTKIGWDGNEWAEPKDVTAKLIGTAIKGTRAGEILTSFNAG